MKLMIASDIHGSNFYCSKLLKRYMEESPDKLIILGDLLYHGPRNELPKEYDPERVAKLFNLVKDHIICVKGNCDAEVDQWLVDFPIISEMGCIMIDGISMYITHGHKYNYENKPPMCPHDILIFGHTHVPFAEDCEEGLFINPGSVSIPKEGSKNSYLIYENGVFLWKDLDGEVYKSLEL